MSVKKKLKDEVHDDAKPEIRALVNLSDKKAVFVGDCLRQLHFWCESGVPEGLEGTVPRPGVVMYAIGHEDIDAIVRFVVHGGRLRLLAAGLFSQDDAVVNAAISRI